MSALPSAETRVFAVLGRPVTHSLSPAMQGAALVARGLDAVYVALDCGVDEVVGLVRGLARAGGGGNVTLPHKPRVAAAVDERTSAVERTGACNTFWAEGGRVVGDNTDVEGVRGAVASLLGADPDGRRVLVLGAGGAARAAVAALLDGGAGEVGVHNRTAARAVALATASGDDRVRAVEDPGRWAAGGGIDLLVQATRLGLDDADPVPWNLAEQPLPGAVLDLVYGARPTPLVREARARGIPAADGREMLVLQGAAAFRRWFGDPVPVDAMRSALGVPPA